MSKPKKKSVFVISPIGKSGTETRKHADLLYNSLILPACPPEEFVVSRADLESRPGMITDQVINSIVEADVCIVDLSFLNPNVFYELGVRHAVRKPTIHIADEGTDLPFDNVGHRVIFFDLTDWGSHKTFKGALERALKDVWADDFVVTNPVTQAGAKAEIRESSDPIQQVIGDLANRLERLEGERSRARRTDLHFEVIDGAVVLSDVRHEVISDFIDIFGNFSNSKKQVRTEILVDQLRKRKYPTGLIDVISEFFGIVSVQFGPDSIVLSDEIPF